MQSASRLSPGIVLLSVEKLRQQFDLMSFDQIDEGDTAYSEDSAADSAAWSAELAAWSAARLEARSAERSAAYETERDDLIRVFNLIREQR